MSNEHKRFNLNQPREGTTPSRTGCRTRRLPRDPDVERHGHAGFEGLSLRLDKRYSPGCSSPAAIRSRDNKDNGSGEVEANDTAFAWDHDAD